MLTTLETLKKRTSVSTTGRGHDTGPWIDSEDSMSSHRVCLKCGAFVAVHTDPAPNGIDIHGTAVALQCGDYDERRSLSLLKRDAEEIVRFYGHELRPWRDACGKTSGSHCSKCGCIVVLDLDAGPDENVIAGGAILRQCGS